MIVYDSDYANEWLNPDSSQFLDSYSNNDTGSLASWIVTSVFDLHLTNDAGGSLTGYDIVHRDAYQMIQLSLAEELVNGDLYECYADEYGNVKFYHIGYESGPGSYLYKLESDYRREPVEHVIVSGFDPPPERVVGESRDVLEDSEISILGEVGETEFCTYKQDGYIIYPKQTEIERYEANPKEYEQIVAHLYSITVPFYDPKYTSVDFANTSLKYDVLDSFGKLQTQKWKRSGGPYEPAYCSEKFEVDDDTGVTINYGDKFLGIKAVYIFGYRLKHIGLDIHFEHGSRVEGPAKFLVDLDTTKSELFQLSNGTDYVVVQDSDNSYRIVFSCNVSPNFVDSFDDIEGATFRISPSSIFADSEISAYKDISDILNPAHEVDGYLRDGITHVKNTDIYDNQIFPLNEGNSGYAVEKIIVAYEWDSPCIHISDLRNNLSSDDLTTVSFVEYPIKMIDKPAPVSMNGSSLDPSETISDLDISTTEPLTTNEYTDAFNSLQKGDINISLPFLTQEECNSVSSTILDIANKDFRTNTYICEPNVDVSLGGTIDGEIINSISYSYQDSSQYFISVTTGPMWLGVGSWSTVLRKKKTESVSAEGIVGSVSPDNSTCEVYIPRKGESLLCVNGSKSILHTGDKVSVSISNNPQEE